jgi:hypothetical protein
VQSLRRFTGSTKSNFLSLYDYVIFVPVLVVDAPLFTDTLAGDGGPVLAPADRCTLVWGTA